MADTDFRSFRDFYPYYLGEHSNSLNRRLHFAGTTCVLALFLAAIISANAWLLLALPLAGYGFAWIGHFFVERNKPATFRHPFYSLLGDFVMYKDMLTGKVRW
ncbi:MAG: DUF962 domain-containing protein [Pseudomonadota bacterium]